MYNQIMRTEDLKNFITICEIGSLNKAADPLNVSQQGLSRSVRTLEDTIGARLFVRSNKGVELTSYGKEFLVYAKDVVREVDKLETFIDNNRESKKDNLKIGLRISANASPMSSAIDNTVEDFGQINKDISIIIHSANQDTLLDELKSGEVDAVQVIGPVDEKRFDIYPIFEYELYVIASKAFKFKNSDVVYREELKDLPLVLPSQNNPLCKQIVKMYEDMGSNLNVMNYEASAKTLTHLVHRKNGIGFLPENSAIVVTEMYPDVRMYKIVPEIKFSYSIVINKGANKNNRLKQLIEYLKKYSETNLIPDSI